MDDWKNWHGFRGQSSWKLPKLAAKSEEYNRADQGNLIKANEYLDEDDVLDQKIDLVVDMIKKAKCLVAYTGAGLSKASGISDYASKAANSIVKGPKIASSLDAQPTYAHHVLTALERAGYLHHYVQQNHDGLPQKAGFPQEKINEIHGAWFDPSNPVVKFGGQLREDLFNWMVQMEKKVDMCLCLGTSLSGMNADRMARTPAVKFLKGRTLGTVIINLQQTPMDDIIWAKLDDTFRLIAKKLNLNVTPITVPVPKRDIFQVPYNSKGLLDPSCSMTWDLSPGSSVFIPVKGASNEGCVGSIVGKKDDSYVVEVEEKGFPRRRRFGFWWIDSALRGAVPHLPVINVNPKVVPATSRDEDMPDVDEEEMTVEEEVEDKQKEPQSGRQEELPAYLKIYQSHQKIPGVSEGNCHNWGLRLAPKYHKYVASVTYKLHPTFTPRVVKRTDPPFELDRLGWGVFEIGIKIELLPQYGGKKLNVTHELTFKEDGDKCKVTKVPIC